MEARQLCTNRVLVSLRPNETDQERRARDISLARDPSSRYLIWLVFDPVSHDKAVIVWLGFFDPTHTSDRPLFYVFVHTPICHRLKVGPCAEYCYIQAYIHVGGKTFRAVKTSLLYVLAQADVARVSPYPLNATFSRVFLWYYNFLT